MSALRQRIKQLPQKLISALFGNDFFICYSHADNEGYAKKLYQALLARKDLRLSVFLDEFGFHAGQKLDFVDRLTVRNSQCLIYLATPKTLESKWVRFELEEFATRGRLIIPINFGGTLSGKDLLSGEEKVLGLDFENILRIDQPGDAVERAPSPEVVEKILTSLTGLRQYQRRAWILTAIGLVLVGLIGIWLSAQSTAASRALQREALLLVSQAEELMERRPDEAIDLALSAVETVDRKDPVFPFSESTLRKALSNFSGFPLGQTEGGVLAVALAPDGSSAVIKYRADGQARSRHGPIVKWRLPDGVPVAIRERDEALRLLAFKDEEQIFGIDDAGALHRLDSDLNLDRTFEAILTRVDQVSDLTFESALDAFLVVGRGSAGLVDESLRKMTPIRHPGLTSVWVSRSRPLIVTGGQDGWGAVWEWAEGELTETGRFFHGVDINNLGISGVSASDNGQWMVSWARMNRLKVWKRDQLNHPIVDLENFSFNAGPSPFEDVVYSAKRNAFYIADGKVRELRMSYPESPPIAFDPVSRVTDLYLAPDSDFLVGYGAYSESKSARSAQVWDLSRLLRMKPHYEISGLIAGNSDLRLAHSRNASAVALYSQSSEPPQSPRFVDIDRIGVGSYGQEVRPVVAFSTGVDVRKSGDSWEVSGIDGRKQAVVLRIDSKTGQTERSVLDGEVTQNGIFLAAAGSAALYRNESQMIVWAPEPSSRQTFDLPHGTTHSSKVSMAVSATGRYLAYSAVESEIEYWSLESSPTAIASFEFPGRVDGLHFLPAEDWLVAEGGNRIGIFRLSSSDQHGMVSRFDNPSPGSPFVHGFSALESSPSGRWLAAPSADRNVYLWRLDLDRPSLLQPFILKGHAQVVLSATFDEQEDYLYTGDSGGRILRWDLVRGVGKDGAETAPTNIHELDQTVDLLMTSTQGDRLLVYSNRGAAQIIPVDFDDVLGIARSISANRGSTIRYE